eukprot:scaffold32260_cov132-Isochrysis_galbana.AAC.2
MCRHASSLHGPCSPPAGQTAPRDVHASFEAIGAYQPASKVTDHNALDQDQAAIEAALSKVPVAYGQARSVYTEGGNSRAYSVLTIPALASGMSAGVSVAATGQDGNPVSGVVYQNAAQGSTQISVVYDVSDVQVNHVRCRVGGLPVELQRLDGCIDITKTVMLGGNSMQHWATPTLLSRARTERRNLCRCLRRPRWSTRAGATSRASPPAPRPGCGSAATVAHTPNTAPSTIITARTPTRMSGSRARSTVPTSRTPKAGARRTSLGLTTTPPGWRRSRRARFTLTFGCTSCASSRTPSATVRTNVSTATMTRSTRGMRASLSTPEASCGHR